MEQSNIEYRLARLEEEALPRRLQTAEISLTQLQGEVTAIKEITNSIGVKLDSGIFELKTRQDMQFQELKAENVKNQSFVKGILWTVAGIIALMQLGPLIGPILKKAMGE